MNKTVILKKNEDRRILKGHLWAFSNEIHETQGEPQAGDIVELRNYDGQLLGLGFFNPHSLIAFRLLSREPIEIGYDFFRKRIESALALRKKLYPTEETFRLIHGEGDFLPGLIVDKYNEYLSIQALTYGMERHLALICDILESLLHPKGIIERNEVAVRKLEMMEQRKGILRGSIEPVTISENGIIYAIDLLQGQKTGFFLDQRENRLAFRRYTNGGQVLDVCCCDGGFALHAAAGKAKQVIAVDVAESAVARAKKNVALNNFDSVVHIERSDMFAFLKGCIERNTRFDVINLDPPSFSKNKKTVKKAKRGYKDLHLAAFKLLNSGGILATSSCSYHISEETFLNIVNDSAQKVGRSLSLLEWHGAAPDHPTLPAMPETKYLKFGIFRVE